MTLLIEQIYLVLAGSGLQVPSPLIPKEQLTIIFTCCSSFLIFWNLLRRLPAYHASSYALLRHWRRHTLVQVPCPLTPKEQLTFFTCCSSFLIFWNLLRRLPAYHASSYALLRHWRRHTLVQVPCPLTPKEQLTFR